MTDLERLGRHVGEQHAIEFWIRVRELGWERYLTPPSGRWHDDMNAGTRFNYVKFMSEQRRQYLHLLTAL